MDRPVDMHDTSGSAYGYVHKTLCPGVAPSDALATPPLIDVHGTGKCGPLCLVVD